MTKGQFFFCLICKKEFYRFPSYIKNGKTKYCSLRCYGKSKIGTENFFNRHKGNTVTYDCQQCRKVKKVRFSIYDKARHHFCSNRCASIFQGKLKSKEKHWNWKGGITKPNHLIRTSVAYKKWQKAVFERDGYACVICGAREKLEADHIKRFIDFPDLRFVIDNGRTLCKPCHTTTFTKLI